MGEIERIVGYGILDEIKYMHLYLIQPDRAKAIYESVERIDFSRTGIFYLGRRHAIAHRVST